MSIAKLSIDLEARLAGLQQGLDKAGLMAEKQAAAISGAFSKANAAAVALGATLAGALGAAGLTDLFRATVDGLDRLNDLKDATGASIENLSALEDVAARTGNSFETMGDLVLRVGKLLNEATPGSDAAALFKDLGLSVDELRKKDPVQLTQDFARALSGFAQDGALARRVQAELGKSYKELAPAIKDLAEAGQLNATVTTEQAEAAERFNKQLAAVNKNALDLTRALVSQLLPALDQYLEKVKRASASGFSIFGRELTAELQSAQLALAVAKVEDLQTALSKDPSNRGLSQALQRARADADALLVSANKASQNLKALVGQNLPSAEEMRGAFLRGDKDTTPSARLGDSRVPKGAEEAAKKAAEARRKLAELTARAIVDVEEQAAQDTAEAWKVWEKLQIESAKERTDAVKEQWRQVFEFIDQQQEQEIEQGRAYLEAIEETGKSVGEEIGLVFSSAAGEAITRWEGFSKLLKGISADLLQIAVKKTITEPLGNFLTDSLKGFSLASLFAANGQAFGSGGQVQPFASGGVVNSPTLFKFANGTGLMGEAGPEAILPLQRGRGGKLGVVAQGGGGVVINQVLHVGAGVSRNEVAAAMVAAKNAAVAEVSDAYRRGRSQ
jgi:hypothetical protein